jgi:hypothetical protein
VLLQNKGDVLPLRGAAKHLAGRRQCRCHARPVLGSGQGGRDAHLHQRHRSGASGWRITHAAGSGITEQDVENFATALEMARKADVVLLCLGGSRLMSACYRLRVDPMSAHIA